MDRRLLLSAPEKSLWSPVNESSFARHHPLDPDIHVTREIGTATLGWEADAPLSSQIQMQHRLPLQLPPIFSTRLQFLWLSGERSQREYGRSPVM